MNYSGCVIVRKNGRGCSAGNFKISPADFLFEKFGAVEDSGTGRRSAGLLLE